MNDEPSRSGSIDKRDKDERKHLAKKKEKNEKSHEQITTEPKEKKENLERKDKSHKNAEKPSTSTRVRSKERTADQSKKHNSEHKKDLKVVQDYSNKRDFKTTSEDLNKSVRRKRSGRRKFLSLASSDESGSFHSLASSSYYSPSEGSFYRSAVSVDTVENLARQQPAQRLSFAQRLAQHITSVLPSGQGRSVQKTSKQQLKDRIAKASPSEQTATTLPIIAKPATAVIDVSVQTSEVQQLPIEQPEIKHPHTKHLTLQIPPIQEVPITEELPVAPTPSEAEAARPHQKRRFFGNNSFTSKTELVLPTIHEADEPASPSQVRPREEEEKSKQTKKQHKRQHSDLSVDTVDTMSDPSFRRHDSNYDHDKGGYASEVDDIVDDSLKRRVQQRKEALLKEAREREKHEKEAHENENKDLEPKRSVRKVHSMSSHLETNLRIGNAFIYMVIPPDGGFAWVIVLMSFLSQVIVDGIVFSVGIILPYMAKDLQASTSAISLVASVQIGCYFFSGPITSAFINKFGFRPVALMGVSLAICTLSIASLSPNLTMLVIFYGVIGGPALSMIWVSSQLIINYYFEKYRPIASGISCSGAGAGVVIFSYLNVKIIPSFDWRNTSRVHIGLLLLVVLIALTFIEVKPTKIAEMPEETETDSEEELEHLTATSRYTRPDIMHKSMHNMKRGLGENLVEMDSVEIVKQGRMERCLITCCPAFGRFKKEQSSTPLDVDSKRFIIRADPIERQDIYYTGPAAYEARDNVSVVDIAGADFKMLSQRRNTIRTINYTLSMMHVPKTTREKPRKKKRSKSVFLEFLLFISPTSWLPVKVKRAFLILFDFRLLKIMEFQVLCLSAILFSSGFNIPFVYSKERAQIEHFYEILIAPAIGFSNLTFRIMCGFIAFKFRNLTTYMCGGGIFFGGLVTMISAFYGYNLVWFQFVYAACYGVAPAFYSTLRSIIYVRSLGLENLTTAFGLTAMGMGIGVFIGTTMGGLLYQLTGGLSASFMFSGICMMTSGLLKLILPTLTKWRNNQRLLNKKITSNV